MNERWIPVYLESNLPLWSFKNSIVEDQNGALILIYEDENDEFIKFKITFKQQVYTFMYSRESYRLETVFNLKNLYDRDLYDKHALFKVINSPFIASILDNSIDQSKLTHFVFITGEDFIDVIASEEPTCISYREKTTKPTHKE